MGKWLQGAQEVRSAMDMAGAKLDDASALEAMALYPLWKARQAYAADVRVRYEDSLYRVVQAHTSQADWTPPNVPALFVKVSLDEWPEWVQPTGAHDAYKKGDKVTYNGEHYVSRIDGNTWSPDAYPSGWEKQA